MEFRARIRSAGDAAVMTVPKFLFDNDYCEVGKEYKFEIKEVQKNDRNVRKEEPDE